MTAFNIHAIGKTAYIMTDTAVYYPDGDIAGFMRKVAPVSSFRAAVMARGHIEAAEWFATDIDDAFDSFDAFKTEAGQFFSQWYGENADALEVAGNRGVEVGIAGISEGTGKAEGWVGSTQDARSIGGAAPFQFHRMDVFFSPDPGRAALIRGGVLEGNGTISRLRPPIDILTKAIMLQRKTAFPYFDQEGFIIGGAAEFTEISRDGISTRVVHDWGDEIGEAIDPDRGAPVHPDLPLNRQQRRAAQREASKRRA